MKRYLIYNTSTGAIARAVVCVPEMAGLQVRPGESAIECDDLAINDATHSVVDGRLVVIA